MEYQAGRAPFADAAASEAASLRGAQAELLAAMALQKGIHTGAQLQTAKVFF